ncbi:MAG: lamin tail domain-containing protein [Candidatus Marinimicrobia bacterium]|nr:lamin tail domain-containing protein [Candidatus Neomarinimicrobiota bacterium]MCF7829080.1 lamin tail domain-containing protein [Candidatus Neomarinimicrobiota bacterium]MCF7881521.1 lamin tail domain-containing protein [Candidatus Neomarinimicrobiota bacterium]
MKRLLQYSALGVLLLFGLSQLHADVIISEVADPGDVYQARFVEIYNAGDASVDLTGWTIRRYVNAHTDSGVVELSGSLAAKATYVIASDSTDFNTNFGKYPDTDGSAISGNGDDTYELFDGSAVIDIYGEVGTDGTGEAWEYEDAIAYRNADIVTGNTVWTASEWTIMAGDVADATPGVHPVVDSDPPAVTNAFSWGNNPATSDQYIRIELSEPVTLATGESTANYSLASEGEGIKSAVFEAGDSSIVYLTYEGGTIDGKDTLIVNNLEDANGNTMSAPDSVAFYAGITSIATIQDTTGSGSDYSALYGETVTVAAIVTGGDASFGSSQFVQDAPGPWNGVNVYTWANDLVRGDSVMITGTVTEYYNKTEIEDVLQAVVLANNVDLPAAYETTVADMDTNESLEGVFVDLGKVAVTDPSLGSGEFQVTDATGNGIVDDAGSYTYSPMAGDSLYIKGIVDYTYGSYKLEPRDDNDIEKFYPLAPKIEGAVSLSDTSVGIRFTALLDTTSAIDTANYALDSGLAIDTVYFVDSVTVELITGSQGAGFTDSLAVANVKDTAGVAMEAAKVGVNLGLWNLSDVTAQTEDPEFPDHFGEIFRAQGIIVSTDFQGSNDEYVMQDTTGGITLFQWDTLGVNLNYRDSVQVVGEVNQYNGNNQLMPVENEFVTVLGSNASLPDTQVITIGEMGEGYENQVIRIERVTMVEEPSEWPESGYKNLHITDGTDTLVMHIDGDTEALTAAPPTGKFTITGVAGQYYDYQIRPRFHSDFEYLESNVLLSEAYSAFDNEVILEFTGVLDQTSAENTANYSFDSGATVETVSLDSNVVSLGIVPPASGTHDTLSVTGVSDTSGKELNLDIPINTGIWTIKNMMVDADDNGVPDNSGQLFVITGTVISPDFGGDEEWDQALYDGTGGIFGFSFEDTLFALGDSLMISGELTDDNYKDEIEVWDGRKLGTGAVPEPKVVTLGDIGQTLEGQLVRVNDVHIEDAALDWPTAGSSASLDVTTESDTLTMRIDSDLTLDEMQAPDSTLIDLIGIVGQFSFDDPLAGFQILPRFPEDIIEKEAVGIGNENGLPMVFDLEQNYPNPFNPTTTIKYQLPEQANVRLVVYNMLGQQVRTLVNEQKEAGYYTVQWDGINNNGVKISSGVYFYHIKAGEFNLTRKMVFMK